MCIYSVLHLCNNIEICYIILMCTGQKIAAFLKFYIRYRPDLLPYLNRLVTNICIPLIIMNDGKIDAAILSRNHKVTYKNTATLARVSTMYNDEVSLNDVPSHKKYFLQLLRAITIISFWEQRNKRRHKFLMGNSILFLLQSSTYFNGSVL